MVIIAGNKWQDLDSLKLSILGDNIFIGEL
jgi:hypothetical protein